MKHHVDQAFIFTLLYYSKINVTHEYFTPEKIANIQLVIIRVFPLNKKMLIK